MQTVYLRLAKGNVGNFMDSSQRNVGILSHDKILEFEKTSNVVTALQYRRVEEVSRADFEAYKKKMNADGEKPSTETSKGSRTHAQNAEKKARGRHKKSDVEGGAPDEEENGGTDDADAEEGEDETEK